MKLQITETQSRDFGSKAGTYTDVKAAVTSVLSVLASEAHDPITKRDVCAVIQSMAGGPQDALNHEEEGLPCWKTINGMLNGLGRAPGRGYYTQGAMVGIQTLSEQIVEAAESGNIRIVTKTGIRFSGNLSLSVDEDVLGYYADDPGLRRTAADQSRCFGFYSQQAGSCRTCPLASFCAEAQMGKLGEIAARLDAETEANLQAALAPEPEVEEAPTTELPEGMETITLPFEGVCSACQDPMAEGSEGVFVEGQGLHHVACLPKEGQDG